jgi:hypothetical protein
MVWFGDCCVLATTLQKGLCRIGSIRKKKGRGISWGGVLWIIGFLNSRGVEAQDQPEALHTQTPTFKQTAAFTELHMGLA